MWEDQTRILTERAPAKVNLTLHVPGRRDDGYHALESLVAFAGAHDRLTLTPGTGLSLSVTGVTAQAAGGGPDNLVLKAARALAARRSGLRLGHFDLIKRLPVAAGLGGGSSDAAAALRLLAQLNGLSPQEPVLREAALATGADVAVCLSPGARFMRGMGEDVGRALVLPALPAVLVNPGVAVATATVFSGLGLQRGQMRESALHPPIGEDRSFAETVAALGKARNDLEDAAALLAPVIVDVLAVLSAAPGCRLARMSGSGATCFGLFETCHRAAKAARVIGRAHPEWWVRPTLLR